MSISITPAAKIVVISGATASGKSRLAMEIARQAAQGEIYLDGKQANQPVIINADSMQVYQGLPILSAQPCCQDLATYPHFLYSFLKHNQNCSLALWLEAAQNIINQALKQGQLPILVGGTGLYIYGLIFGINIIPEIEQSLKNKIRQINDKNELKSLLLNLGDDLSIIENLDKQRMARRLEVLEQTGKSLSWWQQQPNKIFYPKQFFHHINVEIDRFQLYQNCNQRLTQMFSNGALNEAEELLKQNLSPEASINKTIGFLEIKDFLQGNLSKEQAIEIASKKTRNYAKRQLTWFRNQFRL